MSYAPKQCQMIREGHSGCNYFSCGIGPNRKALETLFRYSHEPGQAKRKLAIEELFEPSALKLTEPSR